MKLSLSIKIFILLLALLWTLPTGWAQEEPTAEDDPFHKTIDTAMAISPRYLPTAYTELGTTFFKPLDFQTIDTTMNALVYYDALQQTDHLYQSLGIQGQAHQPLVFSYKKEPGFVLLTPPYPLYFKEQGDLKYYQLKTSFTQLDFAFGIADEYTFQATHAQNIRDKVNVVVNLRGFSNEGYFTHQKSRNIVFDMLAHYEIPSKIYGLKLSYILNNFNFEENGGLLNMEEFVHQQTAIDLKGYNMQLYNAASKLRTHDLLFQQYVNLAAKNRKKDKASYLGTIMHTFQFKQQLNSYDDFDLDTNYYGNHFVYAADTTNDTMRYYTVMNTLQWLSFKPFQANKNEKYYLHLTGGLTHEYTQFPLLRYAHHAFIPFAQMHARLFSVLDIYAKICYTFNGIQKNDVNANATLTWAIQRDKRHFLGADIDLYFRSPDYLFIHYLSNHRYWDNQWEKKQQILHFSAFWERMGYKLEFNYYMLRHYVFFNSDWEPELSDPYMSVLQLRAVAPIYYKGFGAKAHLCLQYSDNTVIQVPLFAGKLDVFYRFNLFKNKAQLQVGAQIAYNTSYYADGYSPLLRAFYHQTEVKVGNYLYFDPHIALQVQRISFYFKVNHALCGLMGYRYFTTPDYPMQDRRFVIGIRWKFFD